VAAKKNKLDYSPLTVKELFGPNEMYLVPKYQRGYAWTDEEVGDLISDLAESFRDFDNEDYLLGQIIVCPESEDNPVWELIDGQQRTTTLYLLILASYLRLRNEPIVEADLAARRTFGLVLNYLTEANGDDTIPRVRVAANGEEYVLAYLTEKPLADEDKSSTQYNIRSAFESFNTFFVSELDDNPRKIWDFLNYVLDKVVLVRLELHDASHALRVFLKVNNRGLTLDDADLLKSLLFRKVTSDDDYDTLSEKWDKASESLFASRLKRLRSMEYLMKALIGIETGKSISTSKVFEEWAKVLKTEIQVKEFANSLPSAAKNIQLLSKRHNPVTEKIEEQLVGTHLFKMVQHFEVLLAGSHLSEESFSRLVCIVEDRAVLSALASEKNQEFERIIHPWAEAVRKLDSTCTPTQVSIASSKGREGLDDLLADARVKFSALRYSTQSHQLKIRYLLARVARDVQKMDGLNPAALMTFMDTSKKKSESAGFDIDHVFPRSESAATSWMGDGYEFIESIGNLVLLHPADNRSQSDALPWELSDCEVESHSHADEDSDCRVHIKARNYGGSGLWVNKALVEPSTLGVLTASQSDALGKIQKTAPPVLEFWNLDAIKSREDFYWQVLEEQFRLNIGHN
jgi:uncharacterized protein with ParB-like and HNH nuclease domain